VCEHDRWSTACHEAGHTVVAELVGMPYRYLTLNPRDRGYSGRVRLTPASLAAVCGPHWMAGPAMNAAGVLAQGLHDELYGHGIDHRDMAERAADDMRALRNGCRYAWHRAQAGELLEPATDPAATVQDLAELIWRHTGELVCQHWMTIRAVATLAVDGGRAVTRRQVRQFVEYGQAHNDPPAELPAPLAAFWPGAHTRLAWRPAGRAHHPAATAAAQTPTSHPAGG
jgi:hypothetical protein